MDDADFIATAEVWLHSGKAAWHFVTLPAEVADAVRARSAGAARAFGSVPVRVTVGATTWKTSLFADAKRASYLLALKEPVRRAEGICEGDTITFTLTLDG